MPWVVRVTAEVEMACQELVEVITDYLEGTLPPEERRRFDAHLAGCTACRIYLEQMRITLAVVGRLSHHDLDAPTRERLIDVFRSWSRRSGAS